MFIFFIAIHKNKQTFQLDTDGSLVQPSLSKEYDFFQFSVFRYYFYSAHCDIHSIDKSIHFSKWDINSILFLFLFLSPHFSLQLYCKHFFTIYGLRNEQKLFQRTTDWIFFVRSCHFFLYLSYICVFSIFKIN